MLDGDLQGARLGALRRGDETFQVMPGERGGVAAQLT
jgi:hypothetical protein